MTNQNCLGSFGRGPYEIQLCQIILIGTSNSRCLKICLSLSSGDHFVRWSGTVLQEGLMWKILVILLIGPATSSNIFFFF